MRMRRVLRGVREFTDRSRRFQTARSRGPGMLDGRTKVRQRWASTYTARAALVRSNFSRLRPAEEAVQVPQLHAGVAPAPARRQRPAVGRETERLDPPGVAGERPPQLARAGVP